MSVASNTKSVSKTFQQLKNEKKNKIRQLRKALNNSEVCCKSYTEADEETLFRILRVKNFNVENAAQAIKKSEIFRLKYPELFSPLYDEYKQAFENDILSVMREKDVNGRMIVLTKFKNWDPTEISLDSLGKALIDVMEELLKKEEAQSNGVVAIVDFNEVGLTQLAKIMSTLNFHIAKRGNDWVKGGVIIQVKSVFGLNVPFAGVQLWKVLRVILNKKIRERFHVSNHIPKEFTAQFRTEQLPKSLNGALNEEDAVDKEFMKILCENGRKEQTKAMSQINR